MSPKRAACDQKLLLNPGTKMGHFADKKSMRHTTLLMEEVGINQTSELPRMTRFVHEVNSFFIRHPFKGAGRIRKTLAKMMMPLPDGPVACSTIYGFEIMIDPALRPGLDRTIYYNGTYEAGTIAVIKGILRPGDTFLDVGSNIGLMSLVASHAVGETGRVIAFEPQPDTYKVLAGNMRLNHRANVVTVNEAIGAATGEATIYSNLARTASASLIPMDDEITTIQQTKIETLADFVRVHAIPSPRMIKIDVEGWELEVLKGAQSILATTQAPALCVEYSHLHKNMGGALEEIYRLIRKANDYTVYRLARGKEFPSRLVAINTEEQLPYHDNLFCLLPRHVKELPESLRPM